jgi:catechol 2,3-dioxygenase-like lactoylglutathione lyase family enzyme
MKLKYIYTRLNVRDYAACKLFYQDVLGFKVSYANDAEEYAELDTGETKITILNRARLKEYIGPMETVTYDPHEAKVALTFAVPNLEEAIAQLKAKGIALVNDPWQRPEDELMQGGVLTVCFRDPDGNLIEFEQFLS